MSIDLTHDPSLQRVIISATDLAADEVRVERSTDQLVWTVVRGGVAMQPAAGQITLSDYEWPDETECWYRVVPASAGLLLPGEPGDYASTPDAPALDITGDLTLVCDVSGVAMLASGSTQALVGKYHRATDNRSYLMALLPDGELSFFWSSSGSGFIQRSSPQPVPPGTGAVRVKLTVDGGNSNRVIRMEIAPSTQGPWALLHQVDEPGVTSVFAGDADLLVGADEGGASFPVTGTIGGARVWNGDPDNGGTLAANPRFDQQPAGTTSFTDNAGREWTVNGDAQIAGIDGPESITPSLGGEIWLKSIMFPALNRRIDILNWSEIRRQSRTGIHEVKGRSAPVVAWDVAASRGYTLDIVTGDLYDPTVDPMQDAELIEQLLTSAGVLFVHVPSGSPVPGGYVAVGDLSRDRVVRHDVQPRVFIADLRVAAQPSPLVVGGTQPFLASLNAWPTYAARTAGGRTYAQTTARVATPAEHEVTR